ncbi:glycosyltransferase family 4 protein [Microbacterium aurum]
MSEVRVVHLVCSSGFAGVENYIVNVATGLARDGVDVAVIGGADAQMQDALAGTGVEWLPGGDMRAAFRSLRSVADSGILHTHMSQADLVGWLHRRVRARDMRQVSTRHFAGPRGAGVLARAVFRLVGRSLATQIAISEFVARHVEPPAEIVYSGVATEASGPVREPYVLAAQRLEPEKRTADVIEAWAQSKGHAAGWRLLIAGEGSERGDLESLARTRAVADSVDFLGHRADIPQLLARAGLVVASTPREGLGMLVLEAMAHATPVVASAGGGHLETVGLATPDLLFAPGDPRDAARVIDLLIGDADLRQVSGEALRDLQRERFTIGGQVAATRALYERVLA